MKNNITLIGMPGSGKSTVGVVTDVHADTLLVYSLVICLKYHLYIFHIDIFDV